MSNGLKLMDYTWSLKNSWCFLDAYGSEGVKNDFRGSDSIGLDECSGRYNAPVSLQSKDKGDSSMGSWLRRLPK